MTKIGGLEITKALFDQKLTSYWWPRKLKKGSPELANCFISNQEIIETKKSKAKSFFSLLFEIWGFATALIMTALNIATFLGLDKLPTDPSKSSTQLPSPFSLEGSVLYVILIGIPIASRFIIANRIASTANVRLNGKDDTITSIPSYKLNVVGGLSGLANMALYFFHDIIHQSTFEIFQDSVFVIFYIFITGVPISLFCLLYIYSLEAKLRIKLLRWLKTDLEIQVKSLSFF